MANKYIHPQTEVYALTAQQVLCSSGDGWAEIGDYDTSNNGGGFTQTF